MEVEFYSCFFSGFLEELGYYLFNFIKILDENGYSRESLFFFVFLRVKYGVFMV